jgi:hypothetical protein
MRLILKMNLQPSVFILFRILTIAVALTATALAQPVANERRLLATAIQSVEKAETGLPDSEKLKLYGQALAALQKITADFPESDISLQIASTGKFGNFAVIDVRQKYLRQAFSYYNKICTVKPSLSCFGYAALQEGVAACRTQGISVTAAFAAHDNLLVAKRVLRAAGLTPEDPIVVAILSEFNVCPTGTTGPASVTYKGYLLSKLAETFIEDRDIQRARSVVEQTQAPLYKFKTILALKRVDANVADRSYVERLKKYVDDQGRTFSKYLMGLSLLEFVLDQDKLAVTTEMARLVIPGEWEQAPPANVCDPVWTKELFGSLIRAQIKMGTLPNERMSIARNVSRAEVTRIAKEVASAQAPLRSLFSSCTKYYEMAIQGVGFLQALGKPDAAKQFANAMLDTDLIDDPQRTIDLFVILAYEHTERTVGSAGDSGVLSINNMEEDEKQGRNFLNRLPPSMRTQGGVISLVSLHARQGRACEAATLLYTVLKGKSLFSQGAMILAKSDALSAGQRVTCGDEELESLLR